MQDAAYGTLLRDPRRALHARIAEILETRFADVAANQPELLARHCTEAGLTEKAASLWGMAGQRSPERSALVEAAAPGVAHFTELSGNHGRFRAEGFAWEGDFLAFAIGNGPASWRWHTALSQRSDRRRPARLDHRPRDGWPRLSRSSIRLKLRKRRKQRRATSGAPLGMFYRWPPLPALGAVMVAQPPRRSSASWPNRREVFQRRMASWAGCRFLSIECFWAIP